MTHPPPVATYRGPATLSPTNLLNVLTAVPAATSLIGTAAEAIEMVICRAVVSDVAAESSISRPVARDGGRLEPL